MPAYCTFDVRDAAENVEFGGGGDVLDLNQSKSRHGFEPISFEIGHQGVRMTRDRSHPEICAGSETRRASL